MMRKHGEVLTDGPQGSGIWELLLGGMAAAGLLLLALVVMFLCSGCSTAGNRIRGGQAVTRTSAGAESRLEQSADPKTPSRQASEHTQERTFTMPAGTRVHRETVGNGTYGTTNRTYIEDLILAADTIVAERSFDKFDTSLGAAQRNTIGEIGEKLKRAWPIMAAGVALLLGGAALFYFGWYTKGALAVGCAVVAFVLYYVIPLHAGAIALGALGVFGFLALLVLYVHYFTKGDVNGNFIPDVLEKK